MLAQLGAVTFDAGLPEARTHLREALREVVDGPDRVDVLTRLAMLNLVDARDEDLTRLFERELADERDSDVRLAVETAALDALMILPARQAERARRVAAIADTPTADPLLSASSRPTGRGSGSSRPRPTRRPARRSPAGRWTVGCCCRRPAGDPPTSSPHVRWR